MQTKMNKNRGLMALTSLALLAMLGGLGWTVFHQSGSTKAPGHTSQQTTTTPKSSVDAAGVTDTHTVTATPESIPESYTVAAGDTLSSIAKKFYGNGDLYWAIERANNLVGSRDNLVAGMELHLPAADNLAANN